MISGFKSYDDFLNEMTIIDKKLNDYSVTDIIELIDYFIKKTESPGKIDKTKESSQLLELYIKLSNRSEQAQEINEHLKKQGIAIEVKKTSDSSYPITEFFKDKLRVKLIFKPIGGAADTTLNSTITELVPILLFYSNLNVTPDTSNMMNACYAGIKSNQIEWASNQDKKSAEHYLDKFETSALFEEKMLNAYHIYQKLLTYDPEKLIWCYRVKPANVPINSRADIYVQPKHGDAFGVSLKAGKTGAAKFHVLNSSFTEFCRIVNPKTLDEIKEWAWSSVYNNILQEYIAQNPNKAKELSKINSDNYWDYGKNTSTTKEMKRVLDFMYEQNPKEIDKQGYDEILSKTRELVKRDILDHPYKFVEFLKEKMGISDNTFPVRTVIVTKKSAEEHDDVSEESMLATFEKEPIQIEISKTAKSDIYINFGDSEKFKFQLRNSMGGNKTAGFFNLKFSIIG